MKQHLMAIVVLTVICIVISAALAGTYASTKPLIEEAERAAADEARKSLLPEADAFTKLEIPEMEGFTEAYAADNGAGYVITTYATGYGGGSAPMTVMTSMTVDGKIIAATMTSQNETAGIGDQVNKESYAGQYVGKDASLEGVTAITGATISSNAFRTAVEVAFDVYDQIGGAAPAPADDVQTDTEAPAVGDSNS